MFLSPVQSSTLKPSLIVPASKGQMGFRSVVGFFKDLSDRVKTIGKKRFDQPIQVIASPQAELVGFKVVPITPLISRRNMQDYLSPKGFVETAEGFRVI